jgi:hypothetical protein
MLGNRERACASACIGTSSIAASGARGGAEIVSVREVRASDSEVGGLRTNCEGAKSAKERLKGTELF